MTINYVDKNMIDPAFKTEINSETDAKLAAVNQQLADTSDEVATLKKRVLEVSITEFGALADFSTSTLTGSDNAQAILDAYNAVGDKGIIKIPNGNFRTTQPLPSSKNVTYEGENSLTFNGGSTLVFDGCSGFVPEKSYTKLKSLSFYGMNKAISIDISNNILGTIGIDNKLTPTINTGGFILDDVTVQGFNVGLALRAADGGTWAGAYRDIYSPKLIKNDINLFIKNGATHNKIIGGVISSGYKHGIYAVNDFSYTNLELIGTTVESNGSPSATSPDYGVYVKNNTKINFIGGYVESQTHFADDGGQIYFNGSHIHSTCKFFAKGTGSINGDASFSAHKATLVNGNGNDYLNMFSFSNMTPTSKGKITAGVKVTSISKNANVIMDNKPVFNIKTLKVNELDWIKFSAKVKVNSGFNAPSFAIKPNLTINALGGTKDGVNLDITLPMNIYDWSTGETQKIEFLYKPRTGGSYLNANADLSDVRAGFLFYNILANVDYSTENLDVDITEVTLEVYTKTHASVLTGL